MKKEYHNPNVEVESFKVEDVVTTSNINDNNTPEQEI